MSNKREHPNKAEALKYAAAHPEATYRQIAASFGVSQYSLADWCKAEGIKRKLGGRTGGAPTKFTLQLWEKMDRELSGIIREHAADGVKVLQETTGKNWRTIQRIAQRCGIKITHKPHGPRTRKPRAAEYVNELPEIDSRVKSCKDCACRSGRVCIYAFQGLSQKCRYHRQFNEQN